MGRSVMRRYMHAVPVLLVGSILSPAFAQTRALLVTGYGTYQQMGAEAPYSVTLAAMQAKSWTVGSMNYTEVLATDAATLAANWDVIWVLPRTDTGMHRVLSKTGSSVNAFVHSGGVVVMPGISTEKPTLDAGPGGVDVLSASEPGPTVIHDDQHPFIAAAANGGVDLTVTDLDPFQTGGGGNFGEPPPGITLTCIARNDIQQIITEYSLNSGKVILSVLDLLTSKSLDNLLLYVDSVVQG